MKSMLKSERIDAALAGDSVDRIPVSFWRHFYHLEGTPRGLADAMLKFQDDYDWDFVKINPRASYHYEDWGASFKFFDDGFQKPERLDYPVKKLSDLEKIKPLDPLKSPVLRGHLDAVHYIAKGLPRNIYYVMTVFTPLSIAGDTAESRDIFRDYMDEDPKLVKQAIEAVTVTFENFVSELLNTGISGLFFATTHWGTYSRMTDEKFDEFSRPYDLRILNLVKDCPLNILHVCKSQNMLRHVRDYPVTAFSWDSRDRENISLEDGMSLLNKTVIGGIDHNKMPGYTPEQITMEADDALRQTGGRRWILGAGCTFEPNVPSRNLKALREWVDQVPVR